MNLTIHPEKGSQTDKACAALVWFVIAIMMLAAFIAAITIGSIAAYVQAGYLTWPEVVQHVTELL